ncbi:MAG: hypothetical protein WC758_03565 [Candidatus Woesearchaeota archaeon]|jgi:hypothetical protein
MGSIKINTKDKSTTIRISDKAKKMLESQAKGKETHEEIILRLIKLSENISTEQSSKFVDKGNIIGTKYEQKNKTMNVEIDNKKYSVVCTYNDLSIIALLRSKQLKNYINEHLYSEWDLNLEIVNVNSGKGWQNSAKLELEEEKILYFACVKKILEETFDIKLYKIETKDDYLSDEKWSESYEKYDLSRDSLRSDIRSHLNDKMQDFKRKQIQ